MKSQNLDWLILDSFQNFIGSVWMRAQMLGMDLR